MKILFKIFRRLLTLGPGSGHFKSNRLGMPKLIKNIKVSLIELFP
jgi:hypothetical protein